MTLAGYGRFNDKLSNFQLSHIDVDIGTQRSLFGSFAWFELWQASPRDPLARKFMNVDMIPQIFEWPPLHDYSRRCQKNALGFGYLQTTHDNQAIKRDVDQY